MTLTAYQADTLVTLAGSAPGYGLVRQGAVVVEGSEIAWVGTAADLPAGYGAARRVHFGDRVITPGLIDCHTHIVFGGDRAQEFETRLNGTDYEAIARAGGGIAATVTATRRASQAQLLRSASRRLEHLIAEGVTTIEIKSGYGLDRDTELRMLRAARRLGEARRVEVKTSFLGAHTAPPEHRGDADAYLDTVCIPALQAAARQGLVDAVDGFCEGMAFGAGQIERVFRAARALDLPLKLHAEQLSHLGGARLAARYGALSADHLEYATEDDARAMAAAGTVAVLLPGAFYTLGATRPPPVEYFRRHGVAMAVATDCNPGSSPLTSILLAMNMGCTLFGLTPREALTGATRHAARALGLPDRGEIAAGKRADLAVWDIGHPSELAYRIGFNPLHRRIFGGAA